MIADLNTYIQYLAALYFTVCIDGAFFKRFWSPDYYRLVQDIIANYKFKQSQVLKNELDDAIQNQAKILENHSVKRGAFMLLICVFLLIYVAFEIKPDGPKELAEEQFPLICSMMYASIVVVVSNHVLTKWRWVVANIIVAIGIFLIIRLINVISDNNYVYFGWVWLFKMYIVLFLSSVIIYQLYVNWLYSQAYVQHLISSLNIEYDRYLKTMKAINNRDKNLCDEVYQKVFSDSYFDNNGQDIVITNFNKAVLDRLIVACQPPTPAVLIKQWFSMKSEDYDLAVIKKVEDNYQYNINEEVIPHEKDIIDIKVMDRLVQEYNQLHGVPISKFCKEKGVNEGVFKGYRKSKLRK